MQLESRSFALPVPTLWALEGDTGHVVGRSPHLTPLSLCVT